MTYHWTEDEAQDGKRYPGDLELRLCGPFDYEHVLKDSKE
eukprot:CAMPEP_0172685932 /NCGR_PEP_ID=MMETSP1074-20121228/20586_1 /TAXON_ID=2916 /ORGANISM="Ceratium fusus, Strain PA161109" /LENGTH=39 /DNA_ID= /DNA_START= /DNA_END= /DNA_ORIENTATION=